MTTHTDDLPARMSSQIGAWEQRGDGRAVFLACYALMTDNMLRAIDAGRFHDSAWVAALVRNFAGYYFAALEAYERDGVPPRVWRLAHDLARRPTTPVVQSLLVGVNAHINCDLVLVLDDMLSPAWPALDDDTRRRRYEDYCTVNTIIGETIDAVQDRVVEPYARLMALVDVVCGPLDEWCTARLIRNWRQDVWSRALGLITAPDDAARHELRRGTDVIALQRIQLLVEGGELGMRVFGYPLRHLRRLRLI